MKIAFVISSINSKSSGNGGHFYSLIETVNQLQKEHEIFIFNVGTAPSEALKKSELPVNYITYPGINFIKIYKELEQLIRPLDVDFIHSFDSNAHLWSRVLSYRLAKNNCLTKCGGVNQIYYPCSKNFINFSKENHEFYSQKRKFKKTNMYLIPNRIGQFKDDIDRGEELLKEISPDHLHYFRFMRISRIGSYYKKGLIQTINLVSYLNSIDIPCILIIIGSIEERNVFDEMLKNKPPYIYFFTDIFFTKNAKEMLYLADAVMGTGRSFMEATSKKLLTLAPNIDGEYPLLITKENFSIAFSYNFSERILIKDLNKNENLKQILKAVTDNNFKKELENFSSSCFQNYFDSSKILQLYNNVYHHEDLKVERDNTIFSLDLLLNFLYVFRVHFQ